MCFGCCLPKYGLTEILSRKLRFMASDFGFQNKARDRGKSTQTNIENSLRGVDLNKFKNIQEAGLASQVLTEVLNTTISFHYSLSGPVAINAEDEFWVVQCGFDYLTALFIWQQEGGHFGGKSRPPWANDALYAWKEWKEKASSSEYAEIERRVAKIFNDFREDVANARSAGYRWSDDIDGWSQDGDGWVLDESDDEPF